MDIAKIRNKARVERDSGEAAQVVPQLPVETALLTPVDSLLLQSSFREAQPPPRQEAPAAVVPVHMKADVIRNIPMPPVLSTHSGVAPLEIILAGREAAGCDEDVPLASTEEVEQQREVYEEFLCFRVSDEIYGINIMDIKEIIKPREVTEVPRAPSFVAGIISLRGVIIPIMDMLDRLGLKREKVTGKERVVVVKNGDSFSGLLVDEVIQVVRINRDSFEPAPSVLDGIDRDFVSGIGRADGRMIILLNLANIADINLY